MKVPPLLLIQRSYFRVGSKRCSFSSSSASSKSPYKVLLFGADDFSCHTLKALHAEKPGLIEEITVITPPDSRTGRNLKQIHRPPLRILAEELSLETIALPSSGLKGWEPPALFLTYSSSHVLIAASFGHLIPSRILSLFPPLNSLNVHPSLLPKYRGAAPIQWCIINGDQKTGVSIQNLSRGEFDKGRILGKREMTVPSDATFESLEPVLAKEGASLLIEVLKNLSLAQANSTEQDSTLATLAPKIVKEVHSRIDWNFTPTQLDQLQRGISHHFPLHTFLPSSSPSSPPLHLQLLLSSPHSSTPLSEFPSHEVAPGTIIYDKSSGIVSVQAGKEGTIRIEKVKGKGGKWISAKEWWLNEKRGRENGEGRFG